MALVLALPAATAQDPNLVIAEFVRLMVPLALTANQLAFLKNALIPGLPDFEWTSRVDPVSGRAHQRRPPQRPWLKPSCKPCCGRWPAWPSISFHNLAV